MTNTEILSKFSFLFKNKIWRDILIIPILFFQLSGTHLFLVTQRNSSVSCKDVNVRKHQFSTLHTNIDLLTRWLTHALQTASLKHTTVTTQLLLFKRTTHPNPSPIFQVLNGRVSRTHSTLILSSSYCGVVKFFSSWRLALPESKVLNIWLHGIGADRVSMTFLSLLLSRKAIQHGRSDHFMAQEPFKKSKTKRSIHFGQFSSSVFKKKVMWWYYRDVISKKDTSLILD